MPNVDEALRSTGQGVDCRFEGLERTNGSVAFGSMKRSERFSQTRMRLCQCLLGTWI